MRFQASLALAFATLSALEVFAQDTSSQSILQILQTNPNTTQLYAILQKYASSSAGFLDGSNNDTYTIFAPSNDAFTPQVLALLPTISDVNDIFLYHILNGSYPTSNFQQGPNIVDTLANNNTLLKWSGGAGLPLDVYKNSSGSNLKLFSGFGNATVTTPDIKAKNGIIYLIDSILSYPQSPSATIKSNTSVDPKLEQFYGALYRLDLLNSLDSSNGLTIFAPNDEAFAGIDMLSMSNDSLSSLLKYHIVNNVYYSTNISNISHPVTVSTWNNTALNLTQSDGSADSTDSFGLTNGTADAKVVLANVLTNNGVIHVIDKVLYPPNSTYNATLAGNPNSNATANSTSPQGSPSGASSSAQVSGAAALLSIVAVVSTFFF